MTTPRRITLAIFAVLAALLLCAGLAAAQEPDEAGGGTRLEPGVNLVGWVGEATPVSELFREIPRLEAIWVWDAELREWIVAAPNAPEWLGGLGRVTAGMGLRMRLGGDQPYLWRRSTEPTRGLVKLRTGWNLVAWSGADGAAIGDVVKGVGWSLRTVRRWDAANQQWVTWTSPERSAQVIANTSADAEIPGIRRGEALWIEVSRAVNWLQPTEILPRLVFPGGASQQVETRVREVFESVLIFYRDQYGIQANPDFTVYVAKNVDALIQAYRDDGRQVSDAREASLRRTWNAGAAWADSGGVVFPQEGWQGDRHPSGIPFDLYVVNHEYFHILQQQLPASGVAVPQWMVEGTAYWAEVEHSVTNGRDRWAYFTIDYKRAFRDTAPTLRSTERHNFGWQYILGWLAAVRLATAVGLDSWPEFWRQLAPTEVGPHGQWESTPDWRTAFHRVFDQSVSGFYTEFNSWQREQTAAYVATAGSYWYDVGFSSQEYDGNWIRGRVAGEGDTPVAGVVVNAISVERETWVAWSQRAETDADGSFAVRAPEAGDYRVSVDINDDCTRHYSNGVLVKEQDDTSLITVTGTDVANIAIQTPPNICGWYIRGQVVGPNAEPLAGIDVSACSTGSGQCHSRVSAGNGSFAVTVSEQGRYRIDANLGDGCSVYFRSGGVTSARSDASPITVADAHISGISIQIPASVCALRISGRFVHADGAPLSGEWLNVCNAGECRGFRAGENGEFAIRVPADGSYNFLAKLQSEPSCWHHLDGEALGSRNNPVLVSGADVTGIVLRLPGTIEELCG